MYSIMKANKTNELTEQYSAPKLKVTKFSPARSILAASAQLESYNEDNTDWE